MIAIAMYISLGVVGTLLLVLLALPMIWRRAVRLTEKRIMAEMPISYGELQAEKDMQRAAQAIELRRLEVLAETRNEEVANQTMKIDKLNQTLATRDETITARLADIEDLNSALESQKQATADTQTRLDATAQNLSEAQADITSLKQAKADVETAFAESKAAFEDKIDDLETHINEQKIELAAQMARIESEKQEVGELTAKLTKESNLLAETKGQLAQKSSDLDHIKERQDKQQTKIDALQSELADKDSEIDTLTLRLERAQEQGNAPVDDSVERLEESEARRAEAEAKIAALSGQLEDQKNNDHDASGSEEQDAIITTLKKEKTDLESALKAAHQIIDRLDRKVKQQGEKDSAGENLKTGDAPLTAGEIALRNQMKSMASLITEMAARQEGAKSPIPTLLQQTSSESENPVNGTLKDEGNPQNTNDMSDHPMDQSPSQAPDKVANETAPPVLQEVAAKEEKGASQEKAQGSTDKNPWEQVFSLTDRIKQMRKSGEDNKTAS